MGAVLVRRAQPADLDRLAAMCHELSPETSKEEHSRELAPILQGRPPGARPLVIFVAGTDVEGLAGFIEVGLRSHADGCDAATPVGYVEGWYVDARHRGHRIGAPLLAAAQDWTRGHGCVEMASDTWIDNVVSQQVHEALGFEVVDRCVHYRKRL
ncbi:MAG TPA: GNAT family N-acetyltransferase [Bryobacteraceae bacterium]|nr:GNAT family N-acetyltransferase [Bryobacteraceae bacterium]